MFIIENLGGGGITQNFLKVKVLVTQLCPTFCNPMDCSHQASLSMEFSRQEYWSGLPLPSPGDLRDPGIEPGSPELQADSLPSKPPGKQNKTFYLKIIVVFNFFAYALFIFISFSSISILSDHIKMFLDYKMVNSYTLLHHKDICYCTYLRYSISYLSMAIETSNYRVEKNGDVYFS